MATASAPRSRPYRRVNAAAVRPLLLLLACGMVSAGCEEDMGQDEWLWIENTTSERVYVQEVGKPPTLYVIGLEPGERARPAHERCDDAELVARSGSTEGPVIATRASEQGRECTPTWVIVSDD